MNNSFISSIGTANPPYKLSQGNILKFMETNMNLDAEALRKLKLLYRASGINHRYTVLEDYTKVIGEFDFFPNTPDLEPFPSVKERMEMYQQEALPLAKKAISKCIEKLPNFNIQEITHLITVSCTGMYAPGLDIELIRDLQLASDTQRTCINFMGCYGAFNGLKVADAICKSQANAKVLVICVELCSLHFQKKMTDDQILSSTLFSDGAAAVLLENKKTHPQALELEAFHCDLFTEGHDDMAWKIGNTGFEMILSDSIPQMIGAGINSLIGNLLDKEKLSVEDIQHWAIHPGGKRILQEIEKRMDISPFKNQYAYEILKEYGNMSSATVLFVIEKVMEQDILTEKEKEFIVSLAFGPGLTLESMILSKS